MIKLEKKEGEKMSNLPDSMYDYRYEHKKAEVVDICMVCNREIYEGESYYDFSGDIVCNDCLKDYIKEQQDKKKAAEAAKKTH